MTAVEGRLPAHCSKCGAAIIWLTHERTGTPAPMDAAPVPGGNVEITDRAGTYRQLPKADVDPAAHGLQSHYASCPNAGEFRRRK